jgi:hypothetical protein
MPRLLDEPQYWRLRAQESRMRADHLVDPEAREIMLDIATGYERLADLAEKRPITE